MEGKLQTVLYVDDNSDHLLLVQHVLQAILKVACDVATTILGAQEKLNSYCYDLIIIDYNLPGQMGSTIAEKTLERDPEQPIMIITEYMTQRIQDFCQEKNIVLLPKFSSEKFDLFVQTVDEMLKIRPCDADKKPDRSIELVSSNVLEAHDWLLKEKNLEKNLARSASYRLKGNG